MRLRSLTAAAAIPLVAAALAACGSSKSSTNANDPVTLAQNARAALASLTTMHVSASMQSSGSPTVVDLSIGASGECVGTVVVNGQRLSVVSAGGARYLRAPLAFWATQVSAAAAARAANKWVTGLPSGTFASCSLASWTTQALPDPASSAQPKVLGTAEVNGTSVINLQVNTKAGIAVLSILKNAPHYVVKMVSTDGMMSEEFSAFNRPIKAVAPTGAINFNSLN